MNKVQLVKEISTKCGFTQKDVKTVLDTMQEVVFDTIKEDDVKIMDGLTVGSKVVSERTARNPQDGSSIVVPEHIAPRVKIGTALKEVVK